MTTDSSATAFDLARTLIACAVRAPSSHNTQPWRFTVTSKGIELHADRTRALPVNDPRDRELTISCGAALFTLEVAAESMGQAARVAVLPRADAPDLLALLEPGEGTATGIGTLARAIRVRRTYRGRFDPTPVPEQLMERLREVAAQHGIILRPVTPGPERDTVGTLIDRGARAQFADPAWRRELAGWLRPRSDGEGLTVPPVIGRGVRAVISRLDMGARTGRKEVLHTCQAPLVVVLGTDGDTPADWLAVGRALQHLLLVAAADGFHAGHANQPCQVASLRPELREVLQMRGHPQLVLRMGRPPTPPAESPRRALAPVMSRA